MTDNLELDELRAVLPNCLRQDRLRLEVSLARWLQRPPSNSSGQIGRWLAEARRSIDLRHRRHERLPQVSYPSNLPITAKKDEIVDAIRNHPVVVIAGETGSGKTTQIPKMCLEAGLGVEGKIGCTQPRRVAALSISRRIAEELKVKWGEEVGCKIRFADRSSPLTYIKLMTDGILLAETQGDRELHEYDAIVIDEAHERSLNIDFLLGHLKLLRQRRPDLKVIITSATIDTEAFSKAFDGAPIIEVSGRTYPVEIRYSPHDPDAEESGDLTYIDAAVSAVEMVLIESDRGDVLIFMPSERDIRETQDDLQGRYSSEAEIIPLFGRLTSGEQDRVFAPSSRRKIIVSTNIAETSLTIPGVRYVIDPGLARISRYSPRTRTKRLPIELISQSSAQQRAGRSGRVENGVCIRLYSQEDLAARPKDTQPEIQRANLAEVILKMKAWRLGEMETFPFLNPPQPQAIQAGYELLQELGALDPERHLTQLGRELARLPVDPSIGRMILQSSREGAQADVVVIAAGLSIQDPRERPLDKQEAADQAHRQFLDSTSDFLTLLNIWNAFDEKLEAMHTQNQMRRFCRAHFLSYSRMREWIDTHAQLQEALAKSEDRNPRSEITPNSDFRSSDRRSPTPDLRPPNVDRRSPTSDLRLHEARYAAVHRSILSGLLGHIAQRVERNQYRVSGNRQIMLWPGSSLFERPGGVGKARGQSARDNSPGAPAKTQQPAWIMAGEMVETSRLFGRTAAAVHPEWIVELGDHVCKRTYGEPSWDARTGRVLVRERITLFGLEIQEKAVDYGRVNPSAATELFIRLGLVEDGLETPHRFLEHNRKLREKIGAWRTRHRNHRLPSAEDALFEFYSKHIENVSSIHDLNRLIRDRAKTQPDFLCAKETDLTGGVALDWDTTAFPSQAPVADEHATLEYAYAPGQEHDGTTVKLPFALAQRVDASMLDWVVPGLRVQQIEFLLKALPKSLRVPLMPLAPKIADLAARLKPETGLEGLRALIQELYDVNIPSTAWKRELLPDHLRPRIAITGKNQQVVASGRDLEHLKQGLEKHETPAEQLAWARAAQQWERFDLKTWSFGAVPAQIEVTEVAGVTLCAFPGLEGDGANVHLRLFRKREQAEVATAAGLVRLAELALQKELAWAQKDLRALEKFRAFYAGWITDEELLNGAYYCLKNHLIALPTPLLPLLEANFQTAISHAKTQLPDVLRQLIEWVSNILRLRQEIVSHRAFASAPPAAPRGVINNFQQIAVLPLPDKTKALAWLPAELEALLPKNFLAIIPFPFLAHWPRYLKALQVRADRALLNPLKDQEKAKQLQPYVAALRTLSSRTELTTAAKQHLGHFRWMLEEFKVSLFAQELGTAQPVSPKRLNAQLELARKP